MEVNKVNKASLNKVKVKQDVSLERTTFQEVMAQRKQEWDEAKLNKLMHDIEDQGKVLAESRTIEDLRQYKALIKQFMDDAIKYGLQLEEKRGFNRRGRAKFYKVVSEVDKKLIDLTDAILKKQKNTLDILDMVGEIKGLLINIYA